MKFKKYKDLGILKKFDLPSFKQLRCNILVATDEDPKWSEPIDCLVDSGAELTTLPKSLLKEMKIKYSPICEITLRMADGSDAIGEVISLRTRILTNEPINNDVLVEVPCVVIDNADEALLGMSILNFYDFHVQNNKLFILRQNENWNELESASFEKKQLEVRSSNVVPPATQQMKPTYPKPLSPPAATKPRKGAFLPPLKPKGGNMPK